MKEFNDQSDDYTTEGLKFMHDSDLDENSDDEHQDGTVRAEGYNDEIWLIWLCALQRLYD